MRDLEGKTCKQAIEIILSENPDKRWKPFELQMEIRERTGELYSESTVTARLRELHIPAQKAEQGRAYTYQWAA